MDGVGPVGGRERGREGELGEETGVCLCVLGGDGAQVTKVGLVAHQHDHDVRICVVAQLAQPALHVLERHLRRTHPAPLMPNGKCQMPNATIDGSLERFTCVRVTL